VTDAASYPFREHHDLQLEPEFREIHSACALTRVRLPHGGVAWLAATYEHVRQVLVDPAFSRSLANRPTAPRLSSEVLPPTSIMAMDAPDHTRLRRALAPAFTSSAVERVRPHVRELVTELLKQMLGGPTPADFVAAVAAPLPVLTICGLLGVPLPEVPVFEVFAQALRNRRITQAERESARASFERYVLSLVERRRREPGDDVISSLLGPLGSEADLSQRELVDCVIALLVGGIGSPTTFLASALVVLLRQPELLPPMAADHATAADVVEELLRLVPIGVGGGFVRVACRDTLVGETTVLEGEAVLPAMFAANRDAARFDDPDRILLGRPGGPGRHLGMGQGAHHCIGASLGRLQAQELFSAVALLAPDIGLVRKEEDLRYRPGLVVRELDELHVTW